MTNTIRPAHLSIESTKSSIQKALISFKREDLLIGIPAKVTKVSDYETKQVVDVKPVIDCIYEDGQVIESVSLPSIFVRLSSAGGFTIKLPVAVGDLVTLHYSHKDISNWLDGDGSNLINPITYIADIRDCYVELGFGTRNNNQKPSLLNMIVEGPNSTTTITPEGLVHTVCKQHIVDAQDLYQVNTKVFEVNATETSTIVTPLHTVDAPNTTFTGNTQTDGTITSTTGVLAPSYSGLGGSGGGMSIGTITVESSVTINGIEVLGHVHSDPDGDTGPMK